MDYPLRTFVLVNVEHIRNFDLFLDELRRFAKYLISNFAKFIHATSSTEDHASSRIKRQRRDCRTMRGQAAGAAYSYRTTQKQLATRLRMTESMISRLERGDHVPSLKTLCRIADAFDRHLTTDLIRMYEKLRDLQRKGTLRSKVPTPFSLGMHTKV